MTRRSWREARSYVLGAFLGGIALLLAGRRSGWLALSAAGPLALFFRDPERPLDPEPDTVYAAADGVVIHIDHHAREPWIAAGDAVNISTFLSLHNVHVNRSPVAGHVSKIETVDGGFFPALFNRSESNRRNRLAIDGSRGRVVVVQIAGMVARRIACWVQMGDVVAAGRRIGMIHFGSRTDVLLPAGNTDVLVRVGDRVQAGVTPIARYRGEGVACDSL